jgi:hypothetical protein
MDPRHVCPVLDKAVDRVAQVVGEGYGEVAEVKEMAAEDLVFPEREVTGARHALSAPEHRIPPQVPRGIGGNDVRNCGVCSMGEKNA